MLNAVWGQSLRKCLPILDSECAVIFGLLWPLDVAGGGARRDQPVIARIVGVGRFTLTWLKLDVYSIFQRDLPVTQGCILLIILVFLVVNLAVDLLYAVIDPRVKY